MEGTLLKKQRNYVANKQQQEGKSDGLWQRRYFVLDKKTGILEYNLISENQQQNKSGSSSSIDKNPSTSPISLECSDPNNIVSLQETKYKQEQTNITSGDDDFEIALYLVGCDISINPGLSSPAHNIYAFTISRTSTEINDQDRRTDMEYHLATSSDAEREQWIRAIQSVSCISFAEKDKDFDVDYPSLPSSRNTGVVSTTHQTNKECKMNSMIVPGTSLSAVLESPSVLASDEISSEVMYNNDQISSESNGKSENIPQKSNVVQQLESNRQPHSLLKENLPLALSTTDESTLYQKRNQNVPRVFAEQNEMLNKRVLQLLEEPPTTKFGWSLVCNDPRKGCDGLVTRKKNPWEENGADIVRSDFVINCNFKDIISLVTDSDRTQECKPSVNKADLVNRYNDQSFVLFNESRTIWPFKPRNVVCFVQLRVYPPSPNTSPSAQHPRVFYVSHCSSSLSSMYKTMHSESAQQSIPYPLLLMAIVLEPIDENKTLIRRFINMDKNVGENSLPKSLITFAEKGIALSTLKLEQALIKSAPRYRKWSLKLEGKITEENLINEVLAKTPCFVEDKRKKEKDMSDRRNLKNFVVEQQVKDNTVVQQAKALVTDQNNQTCKKNSLVRLLKMAGLCDIVAIGVIILPVFALCFLKAILASQNMFLFPCSFFLLIRIFVTFKLGEPNRRTNDGGWSTGGAGTIKCRLDVYATEILRFIGREKSNSLSDVVAAGSTPHAVAEITITHVVIRAVAVALSEMKAFNERRVRAPLLGIDAFYPNKTVNILVDCSAGDKMVGGRGAVKLTNVDKMSVKDIATGIRSGNNNFVTTSENDGKCSDDDQHQDRTKLKNIWCFLKQTKQHIRLWAAEVFDQRVEITSDKRRGSNKEFASCIVLTCPKPAFSSSCTKHTVEIDVSPKDFSGNVGATLVVTVGSIRLAKFGQSRSVLPLSIAARSAPCSVEICRCFAERVEELLQSPEMMEHQGNQAGSRVGTPSKTPRLLSVEGRGG